LAALSWLAVLLAGLLSWALLSLVLLSLVLLAWVLFPLRACRQQRVSSRRH
jgi:hypothetical protein